MPEWPATLTWGTCRPRAHTSKVTDAHKNDFDLHRPMPTIRLTATDSHTDQQLEAFMAGATRLAQETLGASEEAVIIHVETIPATRYMRGGRTIAQRRASAVQ